MTRNSRALKSALAGVLLAASLGGAAAAYSPSALPPPDPSGQGSVMDYRISAQDKLEISVFQVPDLSRSVEVDASGKVLLPLVGQLQASGRTPEEFSQDITAALRRNYVKNPQVTVAVLESTSQTVTIDGAVREPGVYPIAGDTTLLQAVALAKGPDSKLANPKKVLVYRTVGGARQAAMYDLVAIRDGKAPDPLIYGKDVIVVDQSGARSMLQMLGSAMPILNIFRPF